MNKPFDREWQSTKLKHLATIISGQSPSSSDVNIEGHGLPFLQGCSEFGIKSPKPKAWCPFPSKISKEGDWLFSVRAPVGKMNLSNCRYGIGRGLAAISPKTSSTHSVFLGYLLESSTDELKSLSTGSTFEAISAGDIGGIVVSEPTSHEQRQIAAYLNRETAKIDKLIAKQQKLIKLLQEKRQAVISQAVTKGLDPNVKMKDSGVEWLGEVPEHWTVSKISRFFNIKAGGDLKEEYFSPEQSGEYPYPIYTNSTKVDAVYGFSTSYFFPGNSITVTGRGEIGFATYRDKPFDAIIRLLVLTPIYGEYCKFAQYYINSQLRFSESATAIAQLSTQQLAPHTFLYPPPEEQKVICDFLDVQVKKIQGLLDSIELNKQLLQERRQALITAAVTGKIDVRGLVTDEEVAALDVEPEVETTEEDLTSEVLEDTYITEEE